MLPRNKSDQFGEARLGANIVRQDDDATLTGLDADHAVCGLTVVAAFVEAVACGPSKTNDAQASVAYRSLRCSFNGRSARNGGN